MARRRPLRISALMAWGLGLVVTCAACASANVESGGDGAVDGEPGDGATAGDARAQSDGKKDGLAGDGGQLDGGECMPDNEEGFGNNTCADAVTEGNLSDAASSHLSVLANLWPDGDEDWYRVAFVDTADTPGICDKLNIRIAFAQNPGDRYNFDVMLDNCTDPPSCADGEQAVGLTTFSYTDDFACPCVAAADPPNTTDTTHICIDHSVTLRIRVYRVIGAPVVCESYELSLDNG